MTPPNALRLTAPLAALTLALGACKGKEEDTGGEADPYITGQIQPDSGAHQGNVRFHKAFGFNQGEVFIAYISSNPDATCENVAQYLRVGGGAYDPSDMFRPETCNMFIKVSQDYEGGIDYTRDEGDAAIDLIGAGTSIECAMGPGDWALTTLLEDDPDPDYYYTGATSQWWVGNPLTYRYTFSGGDGDDYTLDFELSQLDGGYVHESLEEVRATATVSGSMPAEWCEALASTGLF